MNHSSLLIDHLLDDISRDSGKKCCLAYVYCDYRDEALQTAVHITGTLLQQILRAKFENQAEKAEEILESLKQQKQNNNKLDLDDISQFFGLTLKGFDKIFVCIDALDECNDKQRIDFFRLMATMVDRFKHSLRLFVTGRPPMRPFVERSVRDMHDSMDLEAKEEDIRRYLISELEKDEYCDEMKDDFKHEVIETIISTADGMLVTKEPQLVFIKVFFC